MKSEIKNYNESQPKAEKAICDKLLKTISEGLIKAESKMWHAHPVWFINENPIVGYGKLKGCIRLMFWSGVDFDEEQLKPGTGKFKDASIRYTNVDQVDTEDLKRWLLKAETIQWDYKNVVKRKGKLERLV